MRKTNRETSSQRLAVDTPELQVMLGCGRTTAVKIGTEARARIQIGKRLLWNVSKIQEYMDKLSGEVVV